MKLPDKSVARLRFLYGNAVADALVGKIELLLDRYAGLVPKKEGWSERDAMLFTYGDSLLGKEAPLEVLRIFLEKKTDGLIPFLHLLPFYPFTSDDGFSVVDFRKVREDLGTWDDITNLAKSHRLVFDAVINHVSASSTYMKGYCSGVPGFEDFFVALDTQTDTSSVLRTRNLPLLHEYDTVDGKKWLWTTFSKDQVDLNFSNPEVLLEIIDVLFFYAAHGASMIRLDAIPYLWKELGTSCAHLPQTHELIKLMRDLYDLAAPDVLLLTETNVPHRENIGYFGQGGDEAQMIYNFSLAPLIVWSLFKGDATTLTDWACGLEFMGERATYLNITATHDGIGMRPTEGILSEAERSELVEMTRRRGGDMTGKRNADGSVSPYELNISYFDAINDPASGEPLDLQVSRFMVSQAIPMALMGMPGIYIHSLLGSRNDLAGVQKTGWARSINRAQLGLDQLLEDLENPETLRHKVFESYTRLLRLRSTESAFHPDSLQDVLDLGPSVFAVRRSNLKTGEKILSLNNVSGLLVALPSLQGGKDLLTGETLEEGKVVLAPYQVRWIK